MKRVICRVCLGVGASLFTVSTMAMAQSGSSGPGTPWWVTGVVAVFILLVGAYMRGLETGMIRIEASLNKRIDHCEEMIDRTNDMIQRLNNALLGDYHDKEEIKDAVRGAIDPFNIRLAHVESSLAAIHRRLDKSGFSRVTGQQPTLKGPDHG